MKIGYCRVSTGDQDTSSQAAELTRAGCERIYVEAPMSAMKRERPELTKMMEEARRGDVITVCRLDRLGRSVGHLISLVEEFERRGLGFKSLGEALDTTTPQGVFIFHVMGAMAQFERGLIAERTRATLQHLKAQGVVLGRPVLDRSEDVKRLRGLIAEGKTQGKICEITGWSVARYFRVLKAGGLKSARAKTVRKRAIGGKFTIEMVAGRKGGHKWPEGKAPDWAREHPRSPGSI